MKIISKSAFSMAMLLGASVSMATAGQAITGNFFDENGAYFGPDCESNGSQSTGSFYTGSYTSPFIKYLGKTEAEIQSKLDQMWNHYFKGDNNSKVYFETNEGAYIEDINNQDIRSEGMSYGMMIAVQTNHREEFDKIWNYAKNRMWHKGGDWDGYFSWQLKLNGGSDEKPAPDGELYFMMSLLFAANRWNDSQYMSDAQYIMDKMWNNYKYKLFNQQNYIVTFQPTPGNTEFSDPSYDLPAFLELFSRWAEKDQDKWSRALQATRDHLYVSSHKTTGLFTDYNNFDGTPHSGFDSNNPSDTYMFDAIRCAMNFGMDYYLFGSDATRQTEMAKKIIDFFDKDNYSHAHFTWDGQLVNNHQYDGYTIGQAGANAVATYALLDDDSYKDKITKNLKLAWEANLLTGNNRYYDGLVHYLAMLHLTGNFKIWKPKPTVETKTVDANEYNGVTYNKETTIHSFESCKLYEVKVTGKASNGTISSSSTGTDISSSAGNSDSVTPGSNGSSVNDPNSPSAIGGHFALNAGVRVWSNNHSIVIENALPDTKYMIADLNGRVLKSSRIHSTSQEIRLNNRGPMLVIVGNRTYKIMK